MTETCELVSFTHSTFISKQASKQGELHTMAIFDCLSSMITAVLSLSQVKLIATKSEKGFNESVTEKLTESK